MKVALLGAGRIGRLHATTLAGLPDVDDLLVCDLAPGRATAVAQRVGATPVDSTNEALGRSDAVVIATATDTHAALLGACVEAGLPTFCEKPIALDLDDTRAIVEQVADAGATVQIGFQRRYDAGYCEARRRRASGELGRVYAFRTGTHDPAPPPPGYLPTSGGIYRDLHVHDFDAVRFVLGEEVAEVYATGSVLTGVAEFADHGDVDTSALLLTLADGTLGALTGGRHNPAGYDVRMELFGSASSVAVGLDETTPLRSVEPGMRQFDGPAAADFTSRFAQAYRDELADFLLLARGESDNRCSVVDAYEALRIAVAADRSRAEHRPVGVDEVA